MNGLALAVSARLTPASNAATLRPIHKAKRDEGSLRWLWRQLTVPKDTPGLALEPDKIKC